jgi:hypothetical protein
MEGEVSKKGTGAGKWANKFMRFDPATKSVTMWDKGSKTGKEKGYDVTGWIDMPDREDSKLRKNRVDLSVTPVVTAKSSSSHKSETILALAFAGEQQKLKWCSQFKLLDDDLVGQAGPEDELDDLPGQPSRGKAHSRSQLYDKIALVWSTFITTSPSQT